MTNGDRIRKMDNESLAKLNVRPTYEYDEDYDYEDNPIDDYSLMYKTSDGLLFYDYESAYEHEMEWLNAEYEEESGQ